MNVLMVLSYAVFTPIDVFESQLNATILFTAVAALITVLVIVFVWIFVKSKYYKEEILLNY